MVRAELAWLSMTALAASGIAQDTEVRRLLDQLERPGRRSIALGGLARLGVAAVPALERAFARANAGSDSGRLRDLCRVCEAQGPAAVDLLDELKPLLKRRSTETAALRALGAVAPFAADTEPWEQLLDRHRAGSREGRIEWGIAQRRLQLGARPNAIRLADFLAHTDDAHLCAVFRWMARADHALVLDPRARRSALAAFRRVSEQPSRFGVTWQGVVHDASRAITRHCRGEPEAAAAWAWLLDHPDQPVRIEAAVALREVEDVSGAMPRLLAALEQDDRLVVREVMITLSLHGERAGAAIPALSRKAGSALREHRVLARRVISAIQSRMSVEARLASRLAVAEPDDVAALIPDVAAVGPAVVEHLVEYTRWYPWSAAAASTRVALVERLGSAAAALAPVLVDDAARADSDAASRALGAIGGLGPVAAEQLADLEVRLMESVVRSGDRTRVVEMWRALARVQRSAATSVGVLVADLGGDNPVLRLRAARLLGGARAAAPERRRAAIAALYRAMNELHPEECSAQWTSRTPRLTRTLEWWIDLDDEIQCAAAAALVAIGEPEPTVLEAHARLLEGGTLAQKLAAIDALVAAAPREPRVREWLELATVDDAPRVARAADAVLRRLR